MAEVLVFVVVILPCLLLFSKKISMNNVRFNCFSVFCGLLLCLFLDLITASRFYISGGFLVEIILFVSIVFGLTFVGRRKFLNRFIEGVKYYSRAIIIILIYASGLAFIALYFSMPTFMTNLTDTSGVFPWYFYPYRFGIAFVFMILALWFLAFERKKQKFDFTFIVFILVVLFVFGKIISFLNTSVSPTIIQSGYYERRLTEMMFLPISLLAAWSLTKLSSKIIKWSWQS